MTRLRMMSASRRPLLLIPFAALIACSKLITSGPSCGHDFDFHLLSWMEAAQQWRQGMPYPHWLATANYGAGEPRFVFYPPLSWMLGAALGLIAGWNLAPLLFVAVCLLGCGASMYRLAREWLPLDVSARAAALYMLSPYTVFVVYERTAYGELLAAAFIPLVLLFALRSRPSVAPLALSFGCVWLANAPAGVIAGYMLAFVTVIAAIIKSRWQPVLRAIGAALLGFGLAAFYIVPAAFERRWVQIEQAIAPGMRIEDSFLFGRIGEPFHDAVLRTASWIAAFMLAVAVAAAAGLLLRRRSEKASEQYRRASGIFIPLIALLPLILFLLLPISRLVWAHVPELAFLQFPWRWLMVAGVAYALLAATVLRGRTALALMLLLAVLGGIQQRRFYQPCDDEDAVAPQIIDFKTGTGVEGTDEYVPRGVDNGGIQRGLPDVRWVAAVDADAIDSSVVMNPPWSPSATAEAQPKVEQWTSEHKAFQIQSTEPGFALLRLMDYPAWHVRVNGVDTGIRPHRDDGLLTIPIAAGISHIDVSYNTTKDVWLGRIVSLIALAIAVLVMLMAAIVSRRKPRRAQVS